MTQQDFIARFDACIEDGDYGGAARILVDSGTEELATAGNHSRIIDLHKVLQGHVTDAHLNIALSHNLGTAYRQVGNVLDAITAFDEGLTVARSISDAEKEKLFLTALESAYAGLTDLPLAIEFYKKSLATAQQSQNRQEEAKSLWNLGNAHRKLAEYDTALDYYEQSLAISREIDDKQREGTVLDNMGVVYSALDDIPNALHYFQLALDKARETGQQRAEAHRSLNLGSMYAELGQVQKALGYFEPALAIIQEIDDQFAMSIAVSSVGSSYQLLGEYDKALKCFTESLADQRARENWDDVAEQLINMSAVAMLQSEWDTAIQYLEEALALADQHEIDWAHTDANLALAKVYLLQNEIEASWTALNKTTQANEASADENTQVLQGIIALRRGETTNAQDWFHSVVEICETMLAKNDSFYKYGDMKALSLTGMALVKGDAEILQQAGEAYQKARAIFAGQGHVAGQEQLFEALRLADVDGLIAEIFWQIGN